ncbi:Mandelate racemase/muconate lactonizing enzyme family protein [Escherichia coli]|uniref:Mandelate racemase/muconate lactonizing enzyme family protein n=1 Tax=Escherichia coli TaxID=562 RepID=A0A376L7T8_ECOLX|nr:Mandelate racemase/muconate lactonizing enzyme family protein [Escherichia coli]
MKITSVEIFDCELKKRDQTMASYIQYLFGLIPMLE